MSCFDVGRHLSFHEKSAQDIAATTETTARPAHVDKKKEGATTTVYWRGAERGEFYHAISNMSILV
jgi:purine nucleoside permease